MGLQADTKMQTKQAQAKQATQNAGVLETLKGIGTGVAKSLVEDFIVPTVTETVTQAFSPRVSGEIKPGGSFKVREALTPKVDAKMEAMQKQMAIERHLLIQERELVTKKSQELKLQLHAIMFEVQKMTTKTQKLSEETKRVAFDAPKSPSKYHLGFFQEFYNFLISVNKKVDSAIHWMSASGKRSKKGGKGAFWSMATKSQAYMFSSEHTPQRGVA